MQKKAEGKVLGILLQDLQVTIHLQMFRWRRYCECAKTTVHMQAAIDLQTFPSKITP